MKKSYSFILLFLLLAVYARAHEGCGSCTKLVFKENKGQWEPQVLFRNEMPNAYTFFGKDHFTFLLADTADMKRLRHHLHREWNYKPQLNHTIHLHAFRAVFENANPNATVTGSEKLNEYFNYYLGEEPLYWATGVKAFYGVTYQNLYSGIDLKVYSSDGNMKYDFIVKKNAEVKNISIRYDGAASVSLVNNELRIKTSVGEVAEMKPYAYQIINGKQKEVACFFELNEGKVSFHLPEGYDKNFDLVIDPTLIFSTYSGSTADNFGYSATYDSKDNVYAAGSVFQFGTFPTSLGAFQTSWAGGVGYGNPNNQSGTGTDIAITKYDSLGTQRIYSTYLGGNGDDLPHSLVVNSNDELFVFGTTASSNFPTTQNAFDRTFNGGPDPGVFTGLAVHYATGSDIIISRFNQNGTALLASTYVGGTGNDGLTYPEYQGLHYNYADEVRGEIDIDADDNIYIATCTRSTDFPVTGGAFQTTSGGGMDGVIIKMNSNLTSMIWGTYIGGSDDDAIFSVAFDANNDLYVAGGTQSSNFPVTAGTIQSTNLGGRADGFIAHLNKTGNALLHSTYYGSAAYDQIYFVETSKTGNVYVLGQTEAPDSTFIFNAIYNRPNSGQFISKLDFTLSSKVWSTAFGRGDGNPDISPTAFLVDVCNKMYVSGWGSYPLVGAANEPRLTTTGLDVTPNAFQSTTDGRDFYIMVLEDDASVLSYATFFGSSNAQEHVDGGTSRFNRKGIIYQSVCAGCGGVSTFPTTPNAVSRTNGSYNCNNAVFKFDLELPLVVAAFEAPPTGCAPYSVTFINKSKIVSTATYNWTFGDGNASSQFNPTHTYTQPGLYTVQLVVSDAASCNGSDTATRQILVLSNGRSDTIPTITVCNTQSVQIGLAPASDPNIQYSWTPSNTLSESNVSNPFAFPTQTTTYQLLVSNGLCTDTFRQTIIIFNDALSVSGADVLCAGDTLQLTVTTSQPNQQLTYSWQPVSQIISGANTASPLVSPSQSTTYVVVVVNQIGCAFSDSVRVEVLSSLPDVNAFANPDTIFYGDTTQLGLTLSNNVTSIQWKEDATLSALNIENPFAFPPSTRTYYVEVADSQGCRKTDSVRVWVINAPCEQSNVYIPNAFSPNGDGKNDVLYVRANNLTALYFAVYDRWGQKVFETKDKAKGWDGTFKNKKLDPAVFGWYAEGECEGGEKFFLKGNVTLIR